MSKRVAFSVWPDFPGDGPKKELSVLRDFSISNLKDSFDEIYLCDTSHPFDDFSEMILQNSFKKSYKFYAGWSDYIRIMEVHSQLKQGNTVFYFDYDMLILQPPKNFGVCLETHLQGDSDPQAVDKFWFRGVNCSYYLSPDHLVPFENHVSLVQRYIESVRGKIKFTYPMNYLYPIEEHKDLGYIQNYFLFGAFDDPLYCTEEKIIDKVRMYSRLTGYRDRRIDAINSMGSSFHRKNNNPSDYLAWQLGLVESLNTKLQQADWSDEAIDSLFKKYSTCRIRPNYNSHTIRSLIKKEMNL